MTSYMHNRENNKKFRRLYERSELTKAEIAKKLGVSEPTVKSWLKPETSKSSYACPNWAVDKLKEIVKEAA